MRRSTILKGARLVQVGAFLYFVVEPWLVFLPPNGKTVLRVDHGAIRGTHGGPRTRRRAPRLVRAPQGRSFLTMVRIIRTQDRSARMRLTAIPGARLRIANMGALIVWWGTSGNN